jgi:chorismate synthase
MQRNGTEEQKIALTGVMRYVVPGTLASAGETTFADLDQAIAEGFMGVGVSCTLCVGSTR